MTPNERLYSTLSKVCPGTYMAYKPGKAPPLPWFVYKRQNGGEVFASNMNYELLPRYRVELLFEENDPVLVSRFESALSELGTYKLYESEYLDSEGCISHDYRITLLPNRTIEEQGGHHG